MTDHYDAERQDRQERIERNDRAERQDRLAMIAMTQSSLETISLIRDLLKFSADQGFARDHHTRSRQDDPEVDDDDDAKSEWSSFEDEPPRVNLTARQKAALNASTAHIGERHEEIEPEYSNDYTVTMDYENPGNYTDVLQVKTGDTVRVMESDAPDYWIYVYIVEMAEPIRDRNTDILEGYIPKNVLSSSA